LGIQHTFWSDFTAEIRYVGTRGIHLPAQIRLNTQSVVTPTEFLANVHNRPEPSSSGFLDARLEYSRNENPFVPAYDAAGFNSSFLTSYQPWASSTYHGLAAQLNKRFSHGFQMVGAYTYSI